MLDSRQLLEKGHLFGNELGGSSKEKASASVGFVAGYEACKREYEEKTSLDSSRKRIAKKTIQRF